MATWKELKAQGVSRCGAVFTNGKRCRRRATEDSQYGMKNYWCERHASAMKSAAEMSKAAIEAERKHVDPLDED